LSFLADSSTIFRALTSRRAVRVAGENTLDLARYEVGNAILKEVKIFKTLSPNEAEELARAAGDLLNNMTLLSMGGIASVLEVAAETDLSFYDASYLNAAKSFGLTLSTEDAKLARTAQRLGIRTSNLDSVE
jgi:predicted nucleic acid-binding protein